MQQPTNWVHLRGAVRHHPRACTVLSSAGRKLALIMQAGSWVLRRANMPPDMPRAPQKSSLPAAGWGLAILSFINLFNYLDRYLVSALVEPLKH